MSTGRKETAYKPTRRLEGIALWVALIGFLGMLLVSMATVTEVLTRWLFNTPIEGLEDFKRLAFALLISTAFPMVLIRGENVTIRFLGKAVGTRISYWFEAFAALVVFTFFAFLCSELIRMTIKFHAVNETTDGVELIVWPWWVLTVIVFLFCLPVQLVVLIGEFRRAIRGGGRGGVLEAPGDFGDA